MLAHVCNWMCGHDECTKAHAHQRVISTITVSRFERYKADLTLQFEFFLGARCNLTLDHEQTQLYRADIKSLKATVSVAGGKVDYRSIDISWTIVASIY
jgi:hypothetical protein